MFACLFVPPSPEGVRAPNTAAGRRPDDHGRLLDVARQCSPRVEARAANLVTLDLDGLERLFGDVETLGARVRQAASDAGFAPVHVAVAATRTASILLAVARAGVTVVTAETTEAALAPLPLRTLSVFAAEAGDIPPEGIGDWGLGIGENRDPEPGPGARGAVRHKSLVAATSRRNSGNRVTNPQSRPSTLLGAALSLPKGRIPNPQLLSVFARWGLRTLGQLAALPSDALSARIGQHGLIWQRLARGEDACPLVPGVEEVPFEATHELEWPIESLEPLSFVLGRLLEPLCQRLERRDRAAAVLSLHLRLVTRATYTRSLQLPAPMREPKVLRTLLLLDLESHPAPAGIDAVTIAIEPTPGRIVQESLLERALPAPEQISTLLARLGALMGDRRCGSPRAANSHRPGAFAMAPFRVPDDSRPSRPAPGARPSAVLGAALSSSKGRGRAAGVRDVPERFRTDASVPGSTRIPDPESRIPGPSDAPSHRLPQTPVPGSTRIPDPESRIPVVSLRRFRLPVPARVLIDGGHPISIRTDRQGLQGGRVQAWAGPWRTSGEWWRGTAAGGTSELDRLRGRGGWDRDEWDVALSDGGIYRVFEDRESGRWFVEGIVD